jgi:ribosome-associated heat shock protein Hsp15
VSADPGEALRLDKWLWYARFFKSRSLAARLCEGRRVRLNRRVIDKASRQVRVDDVLRVVALGRRRGPAAEAEGLYEELAPPAAAPGRPPPAAARERGAGRPTKAERRAIERLKPPQ